MMLSDSHIVLVVENDLSVCLYVAELLETSGFIPFTATSFEEALKILNISDNIDLLISDIDLGGSLTGFDLANTARKMFSTLPVIFVTGSSKNISTLKKTRFLVKPYDDKTLLLNIKEIMEENKAE